MAATGRAITGRSEHGSQAAEEADEDRDGEDQHEFLFLAGGGSRTAAAG
jgi:hypothetical protein